MASPIVASERCANCGEPIRPTRLADGYDPDVEWTHLAGGAMCDNGYYHESSEEWHDATRASIGGDGWG